MPTLLTLTSPFTARPDIYVAEGATVAALPLQSSFKLTRNATNASVLTLRPNANTAAGLPDAIVMGSTFSNVINLDVTHDPISGSGYQGVAGLRAIEIQLTADPVTTAEVENDSTEARLALVTVTINSDSGATTHIQNVRLRVNAPGDTAFFSFAWKTPLPDSTHVELLIDDFALATTLRVLTVADYTD